MFDSQKQKQTFGILFALLAISLSLMPFLVAFSESTTKVIETLTLYRFFQSTIVPFEIRTVGAILTLIRIPTQIQFDGFIVNGIFLRLGWNCVGWQSLVFLLLSFGVGLQGKYKPYSMFEAVCIGFLGTFLLNIARIVFIVLLGAYAPGLFVVVFHDYLAVGMTVIWLFFFWWFAYNYVLEENEAK